MLCLVRKMSFKHVLRVLCLQCDTLQSNVNLATVTCITFSMPYNNPGCDENRVTNHPLFEKQHKLNKTRTDENVF